MIELIEGLFEFVVMLMFILLGVGLTYLILYTIVRLIYGI
jgi:hypothetical protein